MKITFTSLLRTSENHVTVTYFVESGKSFSIEWSNINVGTGEVMDSYDYDLQAYSDDESLAELADEALEMGEENALYYNIREAITDSELQDHCVVDSVCIADFDESDSLDDATVTVEYSTGDKVHVQLAGGEYKSGLGCLIFINDAEAGIDDCEQKNFMASHAPRLAEKFVEKESEGLFEMKPLLFNCAINNTSFYLRVNSETLAAEIVTENHYKDEYCPNHQVLKVYETENAAWEEINSYRTDEYHDFHGLNALLIAINSAV